MKKEDNDKNISGIIGTDNGNIVFYAENFKFTLMRTDFSNEKVIIRVDESGYIWGTTYEGKTIAIYSRNDVEVRRIQVLNTWNYIVSKNSIHRECMQLFKGIRFENGVIKTIYPCNALHEDFEKTSGNILAYRIEKDNKEYHFKQGNESVLWRFCSVVKQKMSISEGDSLSNSNSLLDVIFDEKQKYGTLYDYYGYVCDLCSFLTFRDSVSFEKVYLLCESQCSSCEVYAECYIKNLNDLSQRKVLDIIPIRCVNDTVFNNIILNILKVDKKHKGLPLFITHQDDKDAKMMNIGKIRNICSALEMELDLGGVRLEASSEMKQLIDSVKKIIKEHRKGDNQLSERTYDNLFGNISHWDQPLAERACEAWKQHEAEINPLIKRYNVVITQDMIKEFVKARNNITHNGFTGISEEVGITAFILLGLVYSCTLTRLGMNSEEIQNIMDKRLFE